MFLFVGDNVVSIAFKMTTAQVSVLEIFFSSPWNLWNRENWYHVWYDNAFAPLIWTQTTQYTEGHANWDSWKKTSWGGGFYSHKQTNRHKERVAEMQKRKKTIFA